MSIFIEEIPYGTPMQMIRSARNDITPPCPPTLTSYPCKPLPRNKALRFSTITKQFVEAGMPRSQQTTYCGRGIVTWSPFQENCGKQVQRNDIVEKWGGMSYRESPGRYHRLSQIQ